MVWILVINLSIASSLFIINGTATETIDPKYGDTPVIDGYIDSSIKEWNKATKVQSSLGDLPIELWVMQNNLNLFICVQFDLLPEYHSATEFIGILISNSSSEDVENFIDFKIIQFINITKDEFDYFDYHINNSVFQDDTQSNGQGGAKLESSTSIYEFSIPINNNNDGQFSEDVFFEYGTSYAFNITYGETAVYPSGIKKSEIVLINIKAPPTEEKVFINIALLISTIIIFSVLGILYGYYIYKIFKLKGKIKRVRR